MRMLRHQNRWVTCRGGSFPGLCRSATSAALNDLNLPAFFIVNFDLPQRHELKPPSALGGGNTPLLFDDIRNTLGTSVPAAERASP